MKWLCVLILLALSLITLASVRIWSGRTATAGAATPAECVDHYYESLKSVDIDKYLRCLSETYRAEIGQRFFADACRDVKEVKSVVQRSGPDENAAAQWVDVEEVRAAGVRRLRYHLRRDGGNWVIAAIDPPRETAPPIRYGTHVGDEPGDNAP